MQPESYSYYSQPGGSGTDGRKKLLRLVILLVGAVLLVVILALLNRSHGSNGGTTSNNSNGSSGSQKTGTMKAVIAGLPDQNGLSVNLNQKALANVSLDSGGSFSRSLAAGKYTLQVSKPGYKPFSVQFSITPPQTTVINVSLQTLADTTITSWAQLNGASDPAEFDTDSADIPSTPRTISLVDVQYFYNKTWAVITTNDGSLNGYEVAEYSFQANTWTGIAGTSQFFPDAYMNEMPINVWSYLIDTNHTYDGG